LKVIKAIIIITGSSLNRYRLARLSVFEHLSQSVS